MLLTYLVDSIQPMSYTSHARLRSQKLNFQPAFHPRHEATLDVGS